MSDPSTQQHQLSPEEAATLKRKARRGVVVLVLRTILLQLSVLGGNVALARILDPKDFGAFAIIQFALAFFAFFGDAGLGAALIQQRHAPSKRELSSVFLLQILLATVVIGLVMVVARWAALVWPDLPDSAPWLMRILAINLLLVTAKLVPTMLMERELQFGRLSIIEFAQTVSFYVGATVLAVLGFGIWSLLFGVMLQGFTGIVLAYAFRPWFPELVIDWKLLRPILRFGVAFQLKSIVSFINGATAPVYGGRMLGMTSLGFVNWAQNTAYFPLKLVEVIARVSFPLYSRMRDDKQLLAREIGRSIQLCALFTAFIVGLFFGDARNVITVVFSAKWLPATQLLYVFSSAITIGFISPIVGAAFDATGRPGVFTRLSIFWTILNWIAILVATPRWGVMGYAIGYCVHVVVGNVVVIGLLYKTFPGVRLWPRVRAAIAGGLAVWAFSYYVTRTFTHTVAGFIGGVLLCVLVFTGVVFTLDRGSLQDALTLLKKKKASGDDAPKLVSTEVSHQALERTEP